MPHPQVERPARISPRRSPLNPNLPTRTITTPRRPRFTPRPFSCPSERKFRYARKTRWTPAKAVEGRTYAAEIITDDVPDADGNVVIPHGSSAQIIIRSASKGNRFHGQSDLVVDLQSVGVEGQQYLISTTDLRQKGKQGVGANKRTAEYTGGGAVLGTVIGAIAGHVEKGAAIGALAGAGAGAATQIATKGGSIRIPAETVLTFKLDKPVQIVRAQ